ncbi:hypothetical protein B566_EDAN010011 [Ephemera danica]|nr:hypothetical protein B566_EDAN010011 [Ephemera danica]
MALAAFASAQLDGTGDCNAITSTIVANFDWTASEGLWYVQSTYDTTGIKCYVQNITHTATVPMMVRTQFTSGTGQIVLDQGEAVFADTTGDAKLIVNYGTLGAKPYWVLGTDYATYAAIWGCTQDGNKNIQDGGIITRDRFPTTEIMFQAQQVWNANPNIDQNAFRYVNQVECP